MFCQCVPFNMSPWKKIYTWGGGGGKQHRYLVKSNCWSKTFCNKKKFGQNKNLVKKNGWSKKNFCKGLYHFFTEFATLQACFKSGSQKSLVN